MSDTLRKVKVVKCTFYAVYDDHNQPNLEGNSACGLLEFDNPNEVITAEMVVDGEITIEPLWDGVESDDSLNYFDTEKKLEDYVKSKKELKDLPNLADIAFS